MVLIFIFIIMLIIRAHLLYAQKSLKLRIPQFEGESQISDFRGSGHLREMRCLRISECKPGSVILERKSPGVL